ncbi:MAG: phosphatidylcholine/phosphatidylserine synthase [Geminicoccaceae bacterium]|nr:phosphatidylcholine/phosphatidylserine synthase [Geminicoccaceae bacterium]
MKERQRRGFRIRRGERPRPVLHLLPNLFTLMGLAAGMTGMRFALDGRWQLAVGLIIAAVVFDGLDGRSARILGLQSRLGEQLDSLADFLSFGVAPAFIVYLWTLHEVRGAGWALAMIFASCMALRLARFNAEIDGAPKPRWTLYYFKGVPAPCAAGLVLLPVVLSFELGDGFLRSWGLNAGMVLFVALMMVSTIPTFSIKRLRVSPDWVLPTLVLGMVVIVFLATNTWAMLGLMGLAYLLSLPVSWVMAKRMRGRETALPAEADAAPPPPADAEADAGTARIVPYDKRPRA